MAFLVYVPSFDAAWLMDDFPVILNNPDIRSLGNFWSNSYPGRPLREVTFFFDYQMFGFKSFGYHFQHIVWHGLTVFLVFYVAIRLGFSQLSAFFASLLFLVHPIQVEVLANISHRKDILSLAFCLLSFSSYLNWR